MCVARCLVASERERVLRVVLDHVFASVLYYECFLFVRRVRSLYTWSVLRIPFLRGDGGLPVLCTAFTTATPSSECRNPNIFYLTEFTSYWADTASVAVLRRTDAARETG
mgnify:CR=1 FL=1